MREFLWRLIARFVSQPRVADWLIERSKRTPYKHLTGYMNRWWLFNPTPPNNNGRGRRFEWLPSVRIHHILRADHARDPHNHPWPFRTIILRGGYIEERFYDEVDDAYADGAQSAIRTHYDRAIGRHDRRAGDTSRLDANRFHHIWQVTPGGVWTLFISWNWRHVWGFDTDRGFVEWQDYPDANP